MQKRRRQVWLLVAVIVLSLMLTGSVCTEVGTIERGITLSQAIEIARQRVEEDPQVGTVNWDNRDTWVEDIGESWLVSFPYRLAWNILVPYGPCVVVAKLDGHVIDYYWGEL